MIDYIKAGIITLILLAIIIFASNSDYSAKNHRKSEVHYVK